MKLLLLFLILALASTACAQQQTGASGGIPVPQPPPSAAIAAADVAPESHSFRIRLLDGRNGSPVAGGHVKLWYDEAVGEGYILATDGHGIALMPAPVGEPVRILIRSEDATDCRHAQRDMPLPGYSLPDIAAAGKATENTCGGPTVHTAPGELVLFVRPARWYEKLNRTPQPNVP